MVVDWVEGRQRDRRARKQGNRDKELPAPSQADDQDGRGESEDVLVIHHHVVRHVTDHSALGDKRLIYPIRRSASTGLLVPRVGRQVSIPNGPGALGERTALGGERDSAVRF